MPARHDPLTPRQLEVLRWIAEGCLVGVWTGDSHKISARALETRNLAAVSRRAGRWHAELRPDGAYYLEHGQYPSETATVSNNPQAPTRAAARRSREDVDGSELLARLQNGPVRIEAPSPAVRASYRRAITTGAVPDGFALRHTGRDRGDLVISLIEARPAKPTPSAVPIPAAHNPGQPAIQHLLANPETLQVSATSRPRALALIQGLADAAAQRGYELREPRDTAATFRIDIGEDSFAFALREEHDKREQVSPEQIATTKYAWQRVISQPAMVATGRLTLELLLGWRHPRWADRSRWRLQDKFPAVLELIEQHAATARQQRDAAAAARARRRELWEAAVPKARELYLHELNAERLLEQARASAQAAQLLAYCQRLAALAAAEPDPHIRGPVLEWLAWARERAAAVDPLTRPGELQRVVPAEISPADLDRHMPPGMTVRHPPRETDA